MKVLLLIYLLVFSPSLFSQDIETDQESKSEIKKLAFIVGNWKGTGWMMGRDGQKHNFIQTEKISFKLDSTAILIEGLGLDNGKVIHNAMAIINFKKDSKSYNFRSYLANGRNGDFKAELIDGVLYWYPNDNIRYIISLSASGQWVEVGEMKRGSEWFKFFEMTLEKQ